MHISRSMTSPATGGLRRRKGRLRSRRLGGAIKLAPGIPCTAMADGPRPTTRKQTGWRHAAGKAVVMDHLSGIEWDGAIDGKGGRATQQWERPREYQSPERADGKPRASFRAPYCALARGIVHLLSPPFRSIQFPLIRRGRGPEASFWVPITPPPAQLGLCTAWPRGAVTTIFTWITGGS
jgi:hypothetical protein